MSQAEQPEEAAPSLSGDAMAAIEAKRESLERLANTEYAVAEHAEALLEIAERN